MKDLSFLPDVSKLTKDEIVDILLKEEYGYLPPMPKKVIGKVLSLNKSFCAGKADLLKIELTCEAEFGEFTFPISYVRPNKVKIPMPSFIHINFRDNIPDEYQPTEEIVDAGFAVLTIYYNDITKDNGDFTDRLAGAVYPCGIKKDDACGKIGLWAWAICAVFDYAKTLPELDSEKVTVIGHSRLGKTALLAGALRDDFYCAVSNDSGCSGAAIARGNTGETIKNITDNFPFWFCGNYMKYRENEDALPFDQHYLLAANAPHKIYVTSAENDGWACPVNEYLSCVAASEYYEKICGVGFVYPNRLPVVGEYFHDGNIAYHIRSGDHYLSREDWGLVIKYLKSTWETKK